MNIIKKSLAALISFVVASAACDLQAVVPSQVMTQGSADTTPPVTQQSIYPNDYGKSLTTPLAWGAGFGSIYFGAGATSTVQYGNRGMAFSHNVGDGACAAGFGLGNPVDNIGLQTTFVQYDVSKFTDWGMTFQLNHYLSTSQAVAIGVQEVMLSTGGDIGRSYYFVYSQGVLADQFINKKTGATKLHYSLGVGTGAYANKSPEDIAAGKGTHGTYVFGNVAYELFNEFNVISDWNGMNLNAGLSKTFYITKSLPIAITLGAADLTRWSGDRVRMIIGAGTGFNL